MGFTVKKGSEKGSQKGDIQKEPRTQRPLGEYDPSGVRPFYGVPILRGTSPELLVGLQGMHLYLSEPVLPRGQRSLL